MNNRVYYICGHLARVLGMSEIRKFFPMKYIRLADLLAEYDIARSNGMICKCMVQYKKYFLFIAANGLFYPRKEIECQDLRESMEPTTSTLQ